MEVTNTTTPTSLASTVAIVNDGDQNNGEATSTASEAVLAAKPTIMDEDGNRTKAAAALAANPTIVNQDENRTAALSATSTTIVDPAIETTSSACFDNLPHPALVIDNATDVLPAAQSGNPMSAVSIHPNSATPQFNFAIDHFPSSTASIQSGNPMLAASIPNAHPNSATPQYNFAIDHFPSSTASIQNAYSLQPSNSAIHHMGYHLLMDNNAGLMQPTFQAGNFMSGPQTNQLDPSMNIDWSGIGEFNDGNGGFGGFDTMSDGCNLRAQDFGGVGQNSFTDLDFGMGNLNGGFGNAHGHMLRQTGHGLTWSDSTVNTVSTPSGLPENVANENLPQLLPTSIIPAPTISERQDQMKAVAMTSVPGAEVVANKPQLESTAHTEERGARVRKRPAPKEVVPLTEITNESSSAPEWLTLAEGYLRDGMNKKGWVECIDAWIEFEKKIGLRNSTSVSISSQTQIKKKITDHKM
jgi:hypothetical protein